MSDENKMLLFFFAMILSLIVIISGTFIVIDRDNYKFQIDCVSAGGTIASAGPNSTLLCQSIIPASNINY